MKQVFFLILLFLMISLTGFGQQSGSHQKQAPPGNPGYPFTRGLMVDCANEIVNDIANGNVLGLEQELINFARQNFIGYLVLRNLSSETFLNHVYSNSLRLFVQDLRRSCPRIMIGIAGSDDGSFLPTPSVILPVTSQTLFPVGSIQNRTEFETALNNAGNDTSAFKRSELCKFFYRASIFGCERQPGKEVMTTICSFDAFYLEYRFWQQTSSLQAMQSEFGNYTTILSGLRIINRLRGNLGVIDAEFLPTDHFKLQGWTAIDQITEADPLIDRVIVPSFTSQSADVFYNVCKTFHYLSDRFSKPGTRAFIELSAESPSFAFCNSQATPQFYLGDYLNGLTSPSGNMYSIEKSLLDKFNDPNYFCQACSCRPYMDDHYSLSNVNANSLVGVMWTPYTMMKEYDLFRKSAHPNSDDLREFRKSRFQLFDVIGKELISAASEDEFYKALESVDPTLGLYFKVETFSNGETKIEKIFLTEIK